MKTRVGLSQTALNAVASLGGLGQYLSGPLWGRLSDAKANKLVAVTGGSLLAAGYTTMAAVLVAVSLAGGGVNGGTVAGAINGAVNDSSANGNAAFALLALGYLCVGGGSSAVFNSALSVAVKNTRPELQGRAISISVASHGLAAFIFSRILAFFFKDRLVAFLLFMAFVCGCGPILASRFLVHVSWAQLDELDEESNEPVATESSILIPHHASTFVSSEVVAVEEPPSSGSAISFFAQRDVIVLFSAFVFLTGTGLMYINNVGAVVIALSPPKSLPADILSAQGFQVSLLSLCNCAGRLITGFVSDALVSRWNVSRLAGLITGGSLIAFALAVSLLSLNSISRLFYVTILLGLGYGSIFSAAPTIVSSWFGSKHFGTHWGLFQIAPALGGQICNIAFGIFLDVAKSSSPGGSGSVECIGFSCFSGAFSFALVGCALSLTALMFLNHMRGGFFG
ncbi:hypothetical protein HK100_011981 [Physocladia obscura]|uniref:Major facilitator superfamily (MFS) profile domain-containing protein n=1 Tax=Physocladia obscura TaxID=109957 RepID=A0AAD5T0F4_9FUNG|nr:hypothetical protein HK100_011981 [Physocladia obscura]